ncbi:MAG: ABC-2 family transporter protein [Chthonomonadaceae bacterium]|nr:ABC-2 family transporter protein [Chthonomonadaceae bacterium]
MQRAWRQSAALFRIYVQDGLAYKASGLIWLLTDVSTAITMPLVWLAASRTGLISGYSLNDIVTYYLAILGLGGFIVCHFMWDISWEIKDGTFSAHVLRPVSYLHFILVRNLSWRLVRSGLFLPAFALIVAGYWKYVSLSTVYLGWEFWVSVLLGHFVSVLFVTAFAMIALLTQEAQSIFELYYIPMLFLSGQLFPVDLFPKWAQNLAHVFPFYYTTGVPAEILVGRLSPEDSHMALAVQVGWIAVSYALYRILWRIGMRHYTGVGM